MENTLFIGGVPIETLISSGFPIATFDDNGGSFLLRSSPWCRPLSCSLVAVIHHTGGLAIVGLGGKMAGCGLKPTVNSYKMHASVIKHGNGKSPIDVGFNRKTMHKWWIFHCHV